MNDGAIVVVESHYRDRIYAAYFDLHPRPAGNLVQADAVDYLEQHPLCFDFITAMDIIEHFDKKDVFAFVDALHGALKPGGRLIVQTPNAESPWFGAVRYGDFTPEMAFSPQSLSHILQVISGKASTNM